MSSMGELTKDVTMKLEIFVSYFLELYTSQEVFKKKMQSFLDNLELPHVTMLKVLISLEEIKEGITNLIWLKVLMGSW